MVLIGPVERLDQDLDGLADLIAKLVGDFLLVAGALVPASPSSVSGSGTAKKRLALSRLVKGPERDLLFKPQVGVPRGVAGGFVAGASTSIHCSPLVTRPRRTPVAWRSSIIRVSGDAFHVQPGHGLAQFWLVG